MRRLLSQVGPPLMSVPSDASERQANRVASALVEHDRGARPRATPATVPAAPPHGSAALTRATEVPRLESGRPLDQATRRWAERRLRADLGEVRVHTGAHAALAARAIGAAAYTFGSHIVFGRGHYTPATPAGKRLLAHELAHVLQQRHRSEPMIQRQTIGEVNDALNRISGCRVTDPARCPTYEGWISSFRHLPMFATRDTAPDPGASTVCYETFETFDERARREHTPGLVCLPVGHPRTARFAEEHRRRRGRGRRAPTPTRWLTLGTLPAAQQASPRLDATDPAAVVGRFIDHPTDAWVRANLPLELQDTAYGMPADCADIAVILRHVWLVAHRRRERYRGWLIGFLPRESRPRRLARIARVRATLNTPHIHQMVNAYSDASGRPIRSLAQLQRLLHPGDVLVWAHHRGNDPTRPRSGGHTQTILDIFWRGGSIHQIWTLAGNQPVGPTQAREVQRYLGRRGLTSALRFTGGGRIDVQPLANVPAGPGGALANDELRDRMVSGEPVWTWTDGTTLVAAGPPAAAVRRGHSRRPTLGSPHHWAREIRHASTTTVVGVFEAALASVRANLEGGRAVSDSVLDRLGETAGRRLSALASSADAGATLTTMLAALAAYRSTTRPGAPITATRSVAVFERLAAALRRSAPDATPRAPPTREESPLHAGVVRWGRPPHVPPLGVTVPPWSSVMQGGHYVYPDLSLTVSRVGREWVARVGATRSVDAIHPSIALPVGRHLAGRDAIKDASGVVRHYDRFFDISPRIANLIRAAEQEHLDDLELAYQLSLEAAATAVNAAARRTFRAPTGELAARFARAAVARQLHRRLGDTPAQWRAAVKDLGNLTGERDRLNWHEFRTRSNGPDYIDHAARRTIYVVVVGDGVVGMIPSRALIRYENLTPLPTPNWPSERHARSPTDRERSSTVWAT